MYIGEIEFDHEFQDRLVNTIIDQIKKDVKIGYTEAIYEMIYNSMTNALYFDKSSIDIFVNVLDDQHITDFSQLLQK